LAKLLRVFVFFVLISAFTPVSGQAHFRVMGDIPHLPQIDPASITTPEVGMLIYSIPDSKPLIYTGSAWETLCTGNISSITAQEYFVVKNGIPFLPTFSSPPTGILASGTIYYSTLSKALMVYDGSGWTRLNNMTTGTIAASNGFVAGVGVKTVKLPVLSSNPSPAGLVAGAFYINSVSKIIRYYDGSMWQDISCQAIVQTLPITSVTGYTATSGGDVTTNGSSAVTLTGVCWSTTIDPDTTLITRTRQTTTGLGIGIFSSPITGLLPLTTYHVRAYALNSQGLIYGQDRTFTTPIAPPTLITLAANGISSITAQSGGDISSDGGAPVSSRGIIYSSVSDPLTDFLHVVTNDGSGVGYFTSMLNGLLGNTVYYVRSYAVNSAGTTYGNLIQFTTSAAVPPVLNLTLTIYSITGSSATGSATITNNGGAVVTERGVCYSTDHVNYTYITSSTVTPSDIGTFITTLTGLTQGTTYYVKGYAKNSAGTGYTSEISFTTAALAHITTIVPSGLAGTTLNSGGNVLDAGYSVITSRGICWDTLPNPDISLTTKTSETFIGDGTGTYASVMTGLIAGKTYYVRAYVINTAGVSYGQQEQFTLPGFAKVVTLAASSLFNTTATVGGNVLSDGGSPITERGVCWSTLPAPTYGTLQTSDGDGLGIYMSILTGLTPRTAYHYRAYAKNAVGISYGEDRSFTIEPDAPTIITLDITGINSFVATSGGKITSNGGAPITLRGVIWSTKGDPVDDPDQFITNDGSGVGEFPSDMKHLLGTTTYYVRAYAVNAYGTAYGNLLTFQTKPPVLSGLNPPTFSGTVNTASTATFLILHNGGAPITDRGVCYYTTDPTNKTCVPSTTVNPLDIGTFMVDLKNLVPGTTYYIKAYATNAVGTAYSTETSFKTSSLPVVTTTVPSQIQGRSVYSGGTVYYVGDMNLQAHGVVWSTSPNPTIDLDTKTSETVTGVGTGVYTSYLSGLTPNTTYYVRAYAINSDGVGYGENLSFLTADYAMLVTTTPHSMTTNYAVLGGEIYSDGNSAVTERGVCYKTSPDPTYSDSHVADPEAAGIGTFVIQPFKNGNLIEGGLRENTKFYVRAYAVNSAGVAYGNLDSMMMQPSQLIAYDASSITITSFTMSGTVNSSGYRDIGNKGFVWSTTNANPTVSDNSSYDGYWAGGIGRNIFNLPTNTKYYYRVYAYTSNGLKYSNVDSVSTLPSLVATLTTAHPSAMASSSAVSGGTISFNGNTAVTERGVCWSISPNPTLSGNHTATGSGTGTFVTNMTNLLGSTKYYVRAYALNTAGEGYGNLDSLVTAPPVLPAVSTIDAINIGSVKAVGRGNVSDAGGATVTETGVCWNLTGDPTVADNYVKAGSGTGNFSATMTGLTPVTRYYMRAYAVNKVGMTYGDVISFSTFTLATIVTSPVSEITNVTATGGGQISSDGGTPVTTSGICWNTTGVPTIDDSHTTGNIGIGSFIHSMTGLMGSVTYYVRAYATNEAGTAYGQVQSFTTEPPVIPTLTAIPAANGSDGLHVNGGGTIISNGGGLITTEGLVWSTSSSFFPDTVVINRSTIGGSGNFIAIANRLQPGMTYYIRAYAINSAGTGYSDNVVSITTYDYPRVTTVVPDLSSVTSMSVQTGGNITSDGGTEVTENGLCWSIVSPPTISDSVLVNGVGTVSFIRTLTNLFGNATYYVRAYAKNSVGVSYGQVETFTTLPPVLATITTLSTHPTSSTTATGGGNITTNGGALVTTRGVVWGITPAFIPDTVVVNRTATTGYFVGSFNSLMTGLQAGTDYYVRAYVENSVGVTYGELASFRTPNLPSVITNYAYPEGPTKGKVGVIITNRGGVPLSARGVVWSTAIGFNPDTVQVNKMSATISDSIFEMALKNLKGATTYYVMGYATNIAGTTYGNMLSFNTDPAQVATLTTIEATNISWASITSGGIISDNGGEPITTRGMIWSTTHGFRPDTVVVNKTATTGLDDKKFTSGINGLKVNTTYYARAYVTNSIGIAYGNEISFITLSIQTLPASAGSDGYTGSGGGNVIGDTNTASPITNEGIIWSPAHNPTVALSTKTFLFSGPASTGTFYNEMANLMPATTYYVRAYATTAQGIAYGNEVSFTTPVALPILTTNLGTPISRSSVYTGGKISTNGNGAITAKGIIWSINANFNPDTVVVHRTMDGTGSANFTSTATGLQLSTSYYIRAYATNSAGTAYGNQVPVSIFPTAPMLNTVDPTAVTGYSATSGGIITMDGGSDVTLKGMCWATHSNPTVGDFKTTNGAGMGIFSQVLTGLQPNTLYYVRSYAVNSIGTGYGSEKTLLTNGVPTLTATSPVSSFIATTATGGGKITDDGRSPILTRGIVWSIYSNPTIALSTKTVDDTTRTIGSFLARMTGLQPNTTYYVRAYATNGVGTGYGSEASFATLPVMLPSLTTLHPFNVDSIQATGGGNIFDNGGMPVTTRGICWSTTPNPTTALLTKISNAKGGDSIYTNTISGLSPGTKYYIRAYAINTKGTGYGNLDSLTTQAIRSTVSNVVMSGFTQSTATGSATVITTGGAPVISRGLCWNTTGNPSIANDTLQIGAGTGNFADTLRYLVEGPTYYVRAFAINSAGISYSPLVSSFKICPSAFTVLHYEGFNGAAVTKNVTYGSVSSNVSGSAKCWITQNLGADHQAISATDATEPSAGWYWQFNRTQGYQFTSARYPLTWASTFSENSNWMPANDPCNLLLGNGWRIPTSTEWTNAKGAPQNWANTTNAYNSILKLHNAGYLGNGAILSPAVQGNHWSSTQFNNTDAYYTQYNSSIFGIFGADANSKSRYALSLRCLRDSIVISKPSVSDVTIAGKSKTTVIATAAATPDGGAPVMAKGFCWNTTGTPGLTDHVVAEGNNAGIITDSISGLTEGTTYYIRAYAINSLGTVYSSTVTQFKVCLPQFTVQHVAGLNGAPVDKMVTYNSVSATYSGAARCWITQNLGADHQAGSVTDGTEPSAGWYWQFNRTQGYQFTTARTPSTWVSTINETSNWMPVNDPCNLLLGNGWRIPTSTEWINAKGAPQNWANTTNAYNSILKLHNAGYLGNGAILSSAVQGNHWSSTQFNNTDAYYTQYNSSIFGIVGADANSKSKYAFSLRCLRDSIVISKPSVSNVAFSGLTSTSVDVSAIVTPDGGSPVTERGFCWNTTGNPGLTDNPITSGSGTGNFTGTITGGLVEGPTYYVRSYAKNSLGVAYSTNTNSFRICPPVFTVQHIQGIDGAPVSKKVAYHSVSSSLSGKAVCWLTQNLGADSIPGQVTDATEASSGWYWQFNRVQGYKHDGTTRMPAISWISINETSNWTPINDPCTQLLGSGWRIPTSTEWTAVDGLWTTSGNAFASVLKLHNAGYLLNTTGVLTSRGGAQGNYWSNTNATTINGNDLQFTSTTSSIISSDKAYGFPVRCLRDTIVISKPSVGAVTISISSMTGTTADGSSAVGSDGGALVTARGLCWNTTGNPTLADNYVTNSSGGTGNFTNTITGLSEGPKFYVRAFATNSAGTTYGEGSGFSAILTGLCPDTFNIQHNAGFRGAPVTKSVTYHAIGSYLTGAAKCWLTQNLGADHPATSAVDATEASAGWYFQFNHSLGYKNNGTTTTPVAWITGFNEAIDWTAINDPCTIMLGTDWRLPTGTEWTNVVGAPQNWTSQTDAYNSQLKLHNAGNLTYNTSGINSRGAQGNYWSSTRASATTGMDFQFNSTTSAVINNDKAYGFSVRCLREGVVKMPPTLSNVIISTTTMTDSTAVGSSSVTTDGGSTVLTRGICWNTTGNPTINDTFIPANLTDTIFNGIIHGLKEGPTYYVRAYATNKIGLGYSPQTTTFKICPPAFNVIHSSLFNGSPVSKTVTYHSVNSTLSGAARCWTTQNLGADRPALAANDTTNASAGWYWQFNRLQGFKNSGALLIPSTGWVASINESSDWTAATDPCNILLSSGWRIPTTTEWSNAVTNGGWGSKSAYSSDLKLHYGGQIKAAALADRGNFGYYWSSMQTAVTTASDLEFSAATGISQVLSTAKSGVARSLRCLRDNLVVSAPAVSPLSVVQLTDSVIGSATVTPDGGAPVTARGICWGTQPLPTIMDNVMTSGTGVGAFVSIISGLKEGFTYNIRAFATNKAGTTYSPNVYSFKICKSVTVVHVAGSAGAPVSKTVTYPVVSSNITNKLMCWLAQNLGADKQAVSATDGSEAAAGWYFQFNRAQGYKHDGTTRTPNAYPWMTANGENSAWTAANDPCAVMIGQGWRLPTSSEWSTAAAAPQSWTNYNTTYSSVLKIHSAGYLNSGAGALTSRGSDGMYWSSTQNGSNTVNAYEMRVYTSLNPAEENTKTFATTVRCIRDTLVLSAPIVSNVDIPTATMTSRSALGTAAVSSNGGSTVTERGLVWNTTGTAPTIADTKIIDGVAGIGVFSDSITGLKQGPVYYVRAYAVNAKGTAYSPAVSNFKICPTNFTVIHVEGMNGAPVTKTVTYHSINSYLSGGVSKCWITQNLGADQQASSVSDATEASAGWYFQFNRSQGYQFTTTRYPATNWIPAIGESSYWISSNDPCTLLLGNGWRLPTSSEWTATVAAPQNWVSSTSTYSSVLKIHMAGYIASTTGALTSRGTDGMYWSSTQNGSNTVNAYELRFSSGINPAEENTKSFATPVRCLLDISAVSTPSISNVLVPAVTITANSAVATANISADGGSTVTERGFVWNTTGTTPTIADIKIVDSGKGIGSFSTMLTGMVENYNYYIRAYAINAQGITYSLSTTQIKICNPVTVVHVAGSNGAPVSKTVTYSVVSSNVTNKMMCWLAQNLGADQQAASATDGSEASAGWYFQFNRVQGYKHDGTTRTPNAYVWIAANGENSAWIAANDPCAVMIGQGWRLPTSSEWQTAVAAPRNWISYNTTFSSALKIHAAGYLNSGAGALTSRGSDGMYWSSTQNASNTVNAYEMRVNTGINPAEENTKTFATTVRCLRDTLVVFAPTVSNVDIPTGTMTPHSAFGTAAVSSDGGIAVTERGLVWNTTGTAPTIADTKIIDTAAGMGTFSDSITGLIQGPVYYVRAYAINAKGTTYSPAVSNFKICPTNFTAMHVEGMNGAPVTKTVNYHSISINISGGVSKCWLTQNLGATGQAVSATDNTEAAAGWYFQFNRSQGFQYTSSFYPATTWITSIGESANWASANDPCVLLLGNGWRLPTSTEWTTAAAAPQNWSGYNSTYSSALKIHAAGWLLAASGTLSSRGSDGMYWSSTQNVSNTVNAYEFRINTGINPAEENTKSIATPVRCLLDISVVSTPTVSNVLVPAATITSNSAVATANISADGGTTVTERGFVWNITGTAPTISDNKIVDSGTGIGSFSTTLTGLIENHNYYIRAYAINAKGITYSLSATEIKICNPVTVVHVVGSAGAPVSKTITYPVVSSNATNKLMCWLAQNLGADLQATSGNDASDASAGWYFQFNRVQGYAISSTLRTPNAYVWTAANGENSGWIAANDPCVAMIGQGWRLPTSSEWQTAVAAPRNWINYSTTFSSALKIHTAGYLTSGAGTLTGRGSDGMYWSSTQNGSNTVNAYELHVYTGMSPAEENTKTFATPVRCLRDTLMLFAPTVSNVDIPTGTMTSNSAVGNAAVSSDGGSAVTERGLVWNTTGAAPTIADNKIIDTAAGMGTFSNTISGLIQGPVYYVSAYAINAKGVTYSPTISNFKICPTSFTAMHVEGMNGAPVTKTVTYHSINTSISGGVSKCWLTQNLGADQQAASVSDATEASAGWYFQFNRSQGYQFTATRYPATTWIPAIGESTNWLPANDPCALLLGNGWRLPLKSEWQTAAAAPQNWVNSTSTYSSVLKIHMAGYIASTTGALTSRGTDGMYWSSSQNGSNSVNAYELRFSSGINPAEENTKSFATPVRCLLDISAVSTPAISNVLAPAATITSNSAIANAYISADGGTAVTERGFVWNITGTIPTIADNKIVDSGKGIGSYSTTLSGLVENHNYYIRAYAINTQGITYSLSATQIKICNPVTVVHVVGSAGAPVSKTVTYSVVSSNVTNKLMCWLTQNLGSDQQAVSVTDATEASAGWYFQFNRVQGYKHDGTTRTPNAYVWMTANGENSGWTAANDPCAVMIGQGWRLPTNSEWSTATAAPQNWINYSSTFSSPLKIHAAGYLNSGAGALTARGSEGMYWSSTQNGSNTVNAYEMRIYSNNIYPVEENTKTFATSVRCLRDTLVVFAPTVSNVDIPTGTMTTNSAVGNAAVSSEGGSAVTERGLVWNTTGAAPTVADTKIIATAAGMGAFANTISGLIQGPVYYVRAYAINAKGTTYSPAISNFKICPTSFTVMHVEGLNGAPVSKTVTYHSINTSISGGVSKCWLTQNLGADQQATSVSDATESSAGWYFQFNRSQGYQFTATRYPATNWIPAIGESANWASVNDPCTLLLGNGWRLPTSTEWSTTAAAPQNWINSTSTFSSVLKIHTAGYIASTTGVLTSRGSDGMYWSSTQNVSNTVNAYESRINTGINPVEENTKSFATPVRCLLDISAVSTPTISNVLAPAATITSNSAVATAYISADGGSTVTERGFVWNTTGTAPNITDVKIVDSGTGIGSYSTTLTGLVENHNYYIRAYAINTQGITYSLSATQIKICNPVTVVHVVGSAGAPVSKTVTYSVVNSNVTNKQMCWLTQNLGADQQATSSNDASDASAGWYFQFNRVQGYAISSTLRTPSAYTWTTANGENSGWTVANDPCVVMIGQGWRLPTSSEWSTATAAPQNWINYSSTFSSALKIHAAGYLNSGTGALIARGSEGMYWSSTQNGSNTVNAYEMRIYSNNIYPVEENTKTFATSVRCLRDTLVVFPPTVSNVDIPTGTMTTNSAVGNAAVSSEGGSAVTERGLVWNTTGTAPTVADTKIIATAAGMGTFANTIVGLIQGPVYYVRAYAINAKGTTYSPAISNFKICPTSFTVMHVEGLNGAPVTKTVTYHSINTSISGGVSKCWLTQNLGADQQAASVSDATEPSAGWYFQFNRSQGYQFTATRYPATSWIPAIGESANWAPANDPCTLLLGNGWRLPTSTEWSTTAAAPQNWINSTSTFSSVLKIHMAGYIASTTGAMTSRGTDGMYWSSTQNGGNTVNAYELRFNSGINPAEENTKSFATPVRCLLDISAVSAPTISNVLAPAATITSNSAIATAYISVDGGSTVTERGFVWNITGIAPTIVDNKIVDSGSGIGSFSTTLSGMVENHNYYIRAYVKNALGITYSLSTAQIKICNPVTVVHVLGSAGAPVSKTVTYTVVNSNVTNKQMCWLAQNLGSDQPATSVTDGSEVSAGWYFQFNRVQGYKHDGTTRTPNISAWTSSNGENSGWTAANDPCAVMIGHGWRLPTSSEWSTAVAAPRNWVNYNSTYSTSLKIHAAGYLNSGAGALTSRGSDGMYWSSTQNGGNTVNAYEMRDNTGINPAEENTKTFATPVRCIRDTLMAFAPTVSNVDIPTATITSNLAMGFTDVSPDGGVAFISCGLCSNAISNSTKADNNLPSETEGGTKPDTLPCFNQKQTYSVMYRNMPPIA